MREAIPYPCGGEAAAYLAGLIAREPVTCTERARDRLRRIVAVCTVEGRDIGAVMVEAGQAVAYRQYSLDYVTHEERARQAHAGMWSGSFQLPHEWRLRKR